MRVFGQGLVAPSVLFLTLSCGGGSSSPTTPTTPAPTAVTVSSVTVTGPTGSAQTGTTAQFAATAVMSNGTTQTVTGQASWQSSNTNVATVSDTGMVAAVGAGDADIRATYQSVTGSARMSVVSPAHSLCGTIRSASTNGAISGAELEILSGPNAGRKVTADGGGAFCLNDLQAGTFSVRVRGSGHCTADQNVTVSGSTFVTLTLTTGCSGTPSPTPTPQPPPPSPSPGPTPTPGPNGPSCTAASIPSNAQCIGTGTPPVTAVCKDGAFSCSTNRSGTCSTHGGVLCWVCPGALCNGLTGAEAPAFLVPTPLATEKPRQHQQR